MLFKNNVPLILLFRSVNSHITLLHKSMYSEEVGVVFMEGKDYITGYPSCKGAEDAWWQKLRSAMEPTGRGRKEGTRVGGWLGMKLMIESYPLFAVLLSICPFPVLSVFWAWFICCFLSQDACGFRTEY